MTARNKAASLFAPCTWARDFVPYGVKCSTSTSQSIHINTKLRFYFRFATHLPIHTHTHSFVVVVVLLINFNVIIFIISFLVLYSSRNHCRRWFIGDLLFHRIQIPQERVQFKNAQSAIPLHINTNTHTPHKYNQSLTSSEPEPIPRPIRLPPKYPNVSHLRNSWCNWVFAR